MTAISPYINLCFVLLVIVHLGFKQVVTVIIASIIYISSFQFENWGVIQVLILDLILIVILYKVVKGRGAIAKKPKTKVASSKTSNDAPSSGFWAFFDSDRDDHASDYSGGSFDGGGGD